MHINALERVQKKFLRYIGYKLSIPSDTLDYNEVMKILNMKSLHERRIIYDRLFIFKLLNNYIVCPELLGFININVPARILRETNVFFIGAPSYGLWPI